MEFSEEGKRVFILGSGTDQSVLWLGLREAKVLNQRSIAECRPERRHSRLFETGRVCGILALGRSGV